MKNNNKEVCIVTVCPCCGHANEVYVNEEDYWDWDEGVPAQKAFPYLSPDEREMLISGICPSCWDKMFPPEPEEEEESHQTYYIECEDEDDVDGTNLLLDLMCEF